MSIPRSSQFIPVATAYFMPPAVYCRFRTGLLVLQVALEMVFAVLLGYHPRAGLSEDASSAWIIFMRLFISSQTSMILHISFARPLLGRLRHAVWGVRFLAFAQSNVNICSVQQHDGVASRALGRMHAAIFNVVGLGLAPAAPVGSNLACAITANFVLAAVAVAIPEIYWHVHGELGGEGVLGGGGRVSRILLCASTSLSGSTGRCFDNACKLWPLP